MKIDALLAELDKVRAGGLDALPSLKAFRLLKEEFEKYSIPIRHIGKIHLDIDETFFDDEDKARQVIAQFTMVILKIYLIVDKEFGHFSDDIFGDMLSQMSITLHENGEG